MDAGSLISVNSSSHMSRSKYLGNIIDKRLAVFNLLRWGVYFGCPKWAEAHGLLEGILKSTQLQIQAAVTIQTYSIIKLYRNLAANYIHLLFNLPENSMAI